MFPCAGKVGDGAVLPLDPAIEARTSSAEPMMRTSREEAIMGIKIVEEMKYYAYFPKAGSR